MGIDVKYFKCPGTGDSIALVICAARQALENEKCAKCRYRLRAPEESKPKAGTEP